MAETTETPPVIPQAAPSTALPKLDGITQEDLQREIRGDPTPEPKKESVDKPEEKSRVEEKLLDGFGKAAKEMMDKKARGESTEPEKKEEKEVKKEAVSADDAPPVKKEETPDGRLPDDQLQVLPHDKPLTRRRIEQLLKDKADLAKERDEARAAAKANPTATNVEEYNKLKEDHQKANDELIKFRRRYEIDNDDTFKKTYDEPLAQTETAIENTLKKYQLGDATLKAIKDEGGFAAFSRSSKTFAITEKDPETGEPRTVQRTAAELARGWINGVAIADGEFIRSALGKQAMLTEDKKNAVERAVGESKQFFEARQKEQAAAIETAKKRDEELAKGYQTWLKSTTESTDWMKDKPLPDNATEAQKKQITEANEFNKGLRESLGTHPKNSEDYYKMRLEAVESRHLRREMGSKDEQIKTLQAELARVKGANRTTPKGGSLLSDANKPQKKDDSVAPEDFKTAFRKAAQTRMGGDDE